MEGQVQSGEDSQNKQTNKQVEGWKSWGGQGGGGSDDGQEGVLMSTGPQATLEHTTCNNGGGLHLGGHPGSTKSNLNPLQMDNIHLGNGLDREDLLDTVLQQKVAGS